MTQKIILVTIGSLGDLNPFIALAHALSEEGYKPILATSETYREYIRSENIEFFPIKPDITDLKERLGLDLADLAHSMEKNDRFLFEKIIFPYLNETYDDLLPICEDAAAIISHSISFAARPVAEKLRKISFTILLSPLMIYSPLDPPKGSIVPFIDDPSWKFSIAYNQLLIGLLGFMASLWAQPLRKLRSSRALPKSKGLNLLLGDKDRSHHIALFSPSLLLNSAKKNDKIFYAGHSFYDTYLQSSQLPEDLEHFIKCGDPPIIFTLGSFVSHGALSYYKLFALAAAQLSRRAILLVSETDAETLKKESLENVFICNYIRHSLIFPRCCLIVHHGGIGTTGQALKAGVPQIVIPFLGDQFDNAERLCRLGIALKITVKNIVINDLARKMHIILNDLSYQLRAQKLSKEINHENGAKKAAQYISVKIKS